MTTTTSSQGLLDLSRAERTDLANFLVGLTRQQWDAPTLCVDWRVRDVVAHIVSYDILSPARLIGRFLRGAQQRRSPNAIGVEEAATLSTAELLGRLESHLTPTGLTAGFHGAIGLTDAVIHQQDIRRPLGQPRSIPAERLQPALDFALRSPRLPAKHLVRGLRLVATDLDWSTGSGPDVFGTGEALLMAISGRDGIIVELDGPGVPLFRERLGRPAG